MRFALFGVATVLAEHVSINAVGGLGVFALLLGQIAKQLADGDVGGLVGGSQIETVGTFLHLPGLLAHRLKRHGLHQPERLAAEKTAHMFASDWYQMIPEAGDIEIEQAAAVFVLLRSHAFK